MEVSGQLHAPGRFTNEEIFPPYLLNRRLGGTRVGLDNVNLRKISYTCRKSNPGRLVLSPSLYQLIYLGCLILYIKISVSLRFHEMVPFNKGKGKCVCLCVVCITRRRCSDKASSILNNKIAVDRIRESYITLGSDDKWTQKFNRKIWMQETTWETESCTTS
jgi:hypothetical protein